MMPLQTIVYMGGNWLDSELQNILNTETWMGTAWQQVGGFGCRRGPVQIGVMKLINLLELD